jgi:hypothetical protein
VENGGKGDLSEKAENKITGQYLLEGHFSLINDKASFVNMFFSLAGFFASLLKSG